MGLTALILPKDAPSTMTPDEISRLKAILEPQHQAVKEVSRMFHLTYSEAALLLISFHVNDIHATANLYKATLNLSKNP